MYYQESVIDGVLHYKTTPTSPWIAFSVTSMTSRYISSQMLVNELTEQVEQLIRDSNKIDYSELYPHISTKGQGHSIGTP